MTSGDRRVFLAAAVVLASSSIGSFAQTLQPNVLQYSLSNPGARSLGMGGAFAALADDATAVFANAAGLTQLVDPEVSFEVRNWNYSTPFTPGGRLSGLPTGMGLDTVAGLRTDVSTSSLIGPSFLSVVYPRTSWTVAVYAHRSANFESAADSQGFFAEEIDSGETVRLEDRTQTVNLDVQNLGFSYAHRLTENLSVGGGISYFRGEYTSAADFFENTESTLPQGYFGENVFAPDAEFFSGVVKGNDTAWSFNLGVLWQFSPGWKLGGFYRATPAVTVDFELRSGAVLLPEIPAGTLLDSVEGLPAQMPDAFGLSVARTLRNEALTLVFEWDRVRYSKIAGADTTADDVNELRAGVEYVFLSTNPLVALRAGVWHDPDHRVRDVSGSLLNQAVLRPGDDEIHFTIGVGLAFRRFQIDVGVDISDLVKTVSTSIILSL